MHAVLLEGLGQTPMQKEEVLRKLLQTVAVSVAGCSVN